MGKKIPHRKYCKNQHIQALYSFKPFFFLLLEDNHLKCVANVMLKLNNSRNFSFARFLVGLLKYKPGQYTDSLCNLLLETLCLLKSLSCKTMPNALIREKKETTFVLCFVSRSQVKDSHLTKLLCIHVWRPSVPLKIYCLNKEIRKQVCSCLPLNYINANQPYAVAMK